jgi:hypothetical protein
MKAKLIKTEVNYLLENEEGIIIASTSTKDGNNKLSKQNCDEIFRVVDVEKLAKEVLPNDDTTSRLSQQKGFVIGFNKAMELNKDKLFTLEDMMNCWNKALKFQEHKQTLGEYIQSLQQPTEIEVEIEMICPHPMDTYKCGLHYGCDGDGCNHPNQIPYLDSEGCLILKKI